MLTAALSSPELPHRPARQNDGDTRPYYASAALRGYMERHRPSYRLPEVSPAPGERTADQDEATDEGAPPHESFA